MTTLEVANLVLLDKSAKVGGLVQVRYQATHPNARTLLKKVAELNGTWNKYKTAMEAELAKALGRKVLLLNGNYVKQSKGVVSYHGPVKIPGAVYLQRKGYDTRTNTFWLWVIVK